MYLKSTFLITDCGCNPKGSSRCKGSDGHCMCLEGYTGSKCYGCSENYYKAPDNVCKGIVCSL